MIPYRQIRELFANREHRHLVMDQFGIDRMLDAYPIDQFGIDRMLRCVPKTQETTLTCVDTIVEFGEVNSSPRREFNVAVEENKRTWFKAARRDMGHVCR